MPIVDPQLRASAATGKFGPAVRSKLVRKPAFLTSAMTRRLRGYGSTEAVDRGSHLFQQGERLVDFFIVIEGGLELYERMGRTARAVESTLERLQFTG